jgi:predicted nucleic acid-binding protein
VATLIDASVLIAAERGTLDLKRLLSTHEDEIVLSAVTASELLHGVHRASKPEIRKRRQRLVEELLDTFTVVPFDLEIARTHARIWAEMASRGITVGSHDLLIGATALALTASVATRDLRSFPKIPGLEVLHW